MSRLLPVGCGIYTLEVPYSRDLIGQSWSWTATIGCVPTNTEITTFTSDWRLSSSA